jgi:hypothetical protein
MKVAHENPRQKRNVILKPLHTRIRLAAYEVRQRDNILAPAQQSASQQGFDDFFKRPVARSAIHVLPGSDAPLWSGKGAVAQLPRLGL